MKVILIQDVNNLGEEGDIAEVAPGYARNFLFPRKMASMYSAQGVALLASKKAAIEKKKEDKRQAAISDREKILASVVELSMPCGDNGKLFGSVSSQMIIEELAKIGVSIERKKVDVPGHLIKTVGDYKVNIKLYGNEIAELKITIKGISASERAQAARKNAPEARKEPEVHTDPDFLREYDASKPPR